jgi:heptosyltransferase II
MNTSAAGAAAFANFCKKLGIPSQSTVRLAAAPLKKSFPAPPFSLREPAGTSQITPGKILPPKKLKNPPVIKKKNRRSQKRKRQAQGNPRHLKPDNMKLLVHAPNWIGDAVLALPALQRLAKSPGYEIWVAARDWVSNVYTGEEFLAGTISLPRPFTYSHLRRAASEIRKHSFDAGLLMTNSFITAFLFALARIPARWGYACNGRRFLLTRSAPFPPPLPRRHQLEFYQDLITALGFPPQKADFSLTVRPEEKSQAQEFLSHRGINWEKPVVILNPGAFYGPAKRWPPDYYAHLSDLLQTKAQVVVTGSTAEMPLAEEIREKTKPAPVIITGETDIRSLAGILNLADLCVSNDSGPMHLANAVKTPVVALFGPTDPAVTRPFQSPSSYIQKKPVCWPCSYRECPFDHRCMKAVSPDEVFELCLKYLP